MNECCGDASVGDVTIDEVMDTGGLPDEQSGMAVGAPDLLDLLLLRGGGSPRARTTARTLSAKHRVDRPGAGGAVWSLGDESQ